jgi:nucleoid DNA-binding protein
VKALLKAVAPLIVDEVKRTGRLVIPGLGTFRISTVKAMRVVTNGVERVVPAHRALKFRAAPKLRNLGGGE